MKNFSNAEIQLARATPLVNFLHQRGYQLQKEGSGNYRVLNHQGLIIKNNFWYQHSTQRFGNSIEILRWLEKLNFKEAVHELLKKQKIMKSKKEISLPKWKFNEDATRVCTYLTKERYISSALVDEMISKKLIKEDLNGYVCFLGYDQHGNLRYISRRSIGFSLNVFKGEVKNSEKNFSFELNPFFESLAKVHNEKKLILTEGPIDALSIACLQNIKNSKGFFQSYIIATCGYPHRNLINRIKKINPHKIIIAMDNDPFGKKIARDLASLLKITYSVQISPLMVANTSTKVGWSL